MSLSSLDAFLLVAIAHGYDTVYSLMAQAGISVGASRPALRRLEDRGLIRATQPQARGRQAYALTVRGREQARNIKQSIAAMADAEFVEAESVARLLSLATVSGGTAATTKVLERAARVRSHGMPATGAAIPAVRDPIKLYQWMARELMVARKRSEKQQLQAIVRALERLFKRRSR